MTREIKFKGKSKRDGRWWFGNLCVKGTKGNTQIYDPEYGGCFEIDSDTVGQFTGLHDKNGKEIYEGDILCIRQHELNILRGAFRETEIICVVEFRNGAFIPVMSNGIGYNWSNFIYGVTPTKDYTVIGNIYDNPELLKDS